MRYDKIAGDYSIGSLRWNGLSKLVEELGELSQVCGKLIGSNGEIDHWSGNLNDKFIEESGDVLAALCYFIEKNFSQEDISKILDQADKKLILFNKWNNDINEE